MLIENGPCVKDNIAFFLLSFIISSLKQLYYRLLGKKKALGSRLCQLIYAQPEKSSLWPALWELRLLNMAFINLKVSKSLSNFFFCVVIHPNSTSPIHIIRYIIYGGEKMRYPNSFIKTQNSM